MASRLGEMQGAVTFGWNIQRSRTVRNAQIALAFPHNAKVLSGRYRLARCEDPRHSLPVAPQLGFGGPSSQTRGQDWKSCVISVDASRICTLADPQKGIRL